MLGKCQGYVWQLVLTAALFAALAIWAGPVCAATSDLQGQILSPSADSVMLVAEGFIGGIQVLYVGFTVAGLAIIIIIIIHWYRRRDLRRSRPPKSGVRHR